MDFSKASQKTSIFERPNYNPGPGYYLDSKIPKYADVYKTSFPTNPNFDDVIRQSNLPQA